MLRRSVFRAAIRAPQAALVFTDLHGFQLNGTQRIDELNLVAYDFSHKATGASYYHIDTNDTNNTFCIGFRTPAENNKGTSHVLEHTVLCGSRKFPVRDPFFMMLRRSLSTFMNAMTGADFTLYPFSTVNPRDFANLLDVYLDAVLNPLLREEDFKQEGHRVEVEEAPPRDARVGEAAHVGRLTNNGVVYNEMRGVVSEPNQHFARSLMQVMLPQTHYTFVSGGYPPDILQLTYEELVAFHKRHYHPSNSITFTYGNQHPESHMSALNEYFSHFTRSEVVQVPTLSEACRFEKLRTVRLGGPLDAMGNPQRQKRVAMAFGVPQQENKLEDVVALSALDSLLSSGPSSPMYKALIESQIGSKYTPMRGYAYYLSSPIVSYGVAGVDEERDGVEQEVEAAVKTALRSVLDGGFDKRRVQSVIFQEELQQRHRAADYGLNLCTGLCAMGLCRTSNKPTDFINWLPHLKKIGADNGASLIPRITSTLLSNPHQAVVAVSAKKDYLNHLRDQLKSIEDDLNVSATAEYKKQVQRETEEWLQRVRAPQPSDVLPTLKISDIPKQAFAEPAPVRSSTISAAGPAISTIACPTNGLVYVHGIIPFESTLAAQLARGPIGDVPANIPLLQTLLGNTGAGPLSYKEHSIESELVCGGFTFEAILNESYAHKDRTIAGTSFGFYTTKEKLRDALNLLRLTFLEPRCSRDDPEVFARALSQIKTACSSLIQALQHRGHRVAVGNAVARLTRRGALHERWWGLTQSKHAAELLEVLQGNEDTCRRAVHQLLAEYEAFTASLATALSSGIMWATCEEAHRGEVECSLQEFASPFPSAASSSLSVHLSLSPQQRSPTLHSAVVKEPLPIDTSFVGLAMPADLSWSHPDQARVRVACQLLSNEYLHRRVREEGGAYGAGCSASLLGEVGGVTMLSYRDPSPNLTIKAFEEAGEWLSTATNITPSRVEEAKLRLFSTLDAPYAVDTYGEALFLNDVHQTQKQRMRDELLMVSPQDVINVARYFRAPPGGRSVTVLEPQASDQK